VNKQFSAVVTDYVESELDWEAEALAKLGIGYTIHQLLPGSEEDVYQAVKDADVIVVNMVPFKASLIGRLTKCKLVIRHGIGYDNVDVEACTRAGIVFANQPEYCRIDVAEHAIAMILACGRRLLPGMRSIKPSCKAGKWDFTGIFPLRRLEGSTVGILGLGRIGRIVQEKLSSFGFHLIGHDPFLKEGQRSRISGITWVDLETLFSESDFLTVHTPLNENTRHLVCKRMLSLMKPSAYLINTSRGGVVDTDALVAALETKSIAGAAIDVFEKEPPSADSKLLELDNVIMTPHIGWASTESGASIRHSIYDDIVAASEGKQPRFPINNILKL
jgi:D-3-phosphoglycerate dehydrogenase